MEKLCQIRDIYRSIQLFERKLEEKHGLSLNQAMLLCELGKSKKLSSGEIASALGLSNSNASKVISHVENENLIKRILDSKDKRRMSFTMSEKGLKKLNCINCLEIKLPEL